MESAARPQGPRAPARALRRLGSLSLWAGVVVLGAFGTYFTFANYLWFGVGVVVVMLLLVVRSGRKQRRKRRAYEQRRRVRNRDL